MATASRIPDELRAGDTLKWTTGHSDYTPGDGWTLKTEFLNSAGTVDATITAVQDPDDASRYLSTLDASTTANWPAGEVYWQTYVEMSGQRYTILEGVVLVRANLATATSHDGRSHAKKTLDALEAVIEGKASRDQLAYSIAGRSLSRMSPDELIRWRDHYRAEWKRERNRLRAAQGLPRRDRAHIRFSR